MKLAVVGATGLVGSEMLKVLGERNLRIDQLIPVASEKSLGKKVQFMEKTFPVVMPEEAIAQKPSFALFSAGGKVSLEWAPRFASEGITVIDNSSAWRMDPDVPLVVPEINADSIQETNRIIANPNCSTIQMVMVLAPLHRHFRIKRIVVSTYQSVTGTGVKAVQQLLNERQGIKGEMAYRHPIDLNLIPQVDVFLENGYSKEEMKMVNETRKILSDSSISITATTVRVPVMGGHSESVNVEFDSDFDLSTVRALLSSTPGVVVQDDLSQSVYPMPLDCQGRDEVFVGRIRRDESREKSLNLWIVADNLRKGAATNAVQIAELLISRKWVRGI